MCLIAALRRFALRRVCLTGLVIIAALMSLAPLAVAAPRAVLGELISSAG